MCLCCEKNVCTQHFIEHIEIAKAQIDPLGNDVDSVTEKVKVLTVEHIVEPSFGQLHQWKDNMYRLTDKIFLAKSKEINDWIEKNIYEFNERKKRTIWINNKNSRRN